MHSWLPACAAQKWKVGAMVKLDTAAEILRWADKACCTAATMQCGDCVEWRKGAAYMAECVRLRKAFEKLANSLDMGGGLAAPKPTWIGQLRDAIKSDSDG
jgi:hypothetical protein